MSSVDHNGFADSESFADGNFIAHGISGLDIAAFSLFIITDYKYIYAVCVIKQSGNRDRRGFGIGFFGYGNGDVSSGNEFTVRIEIDLV